MQHLIRQWFLISFTILFAILSWFVLEPYVFALITASMLAILFYPVYKKLNVFFKSQTLASLIICACIILGVLIPTIFVMNALFIESSNVLVQLQNQQAVTENMFDKIQLFVDELPFSTLLPINVRAQATNLLSSGIMFLKNNLAHLPNLLISTALMLFILFFLFRDGKKLVTTFYGIVPLTTVQRDALSARLKNVTYAVVYGQVAAALAQGIIATIGYFIFGIKAPIVWGVITTFFALVPFVGTAIIWLPSGLYLLWTGIDSGLWWKGLGLIIYGVVVISTIDNIVRPFFIGERGSIHPVIAFIGVLGGLAMFGIVGVFVGPLILALFLLFLDLTIMSVLKTKKSVFPILRKER
ncbi:MAG TPA: AI-2E family transporter [Acidobacteriota bacterium]|nr:AI-2E family transporter [Acidobacteriota bacterium]